MEQRFSARGTKMLDQSEQNFNARETKSELHEKSAILNGWNKK